MANYKKSPDVERLERLKGSFSAQAKELALPVLTDIASVAGGWITARVIGRPSFLLGLVTYGAGKVNSLHETINREQKRMGTSQSDNAPALSGLNPLYKNEERIYMGDSPLVHFGIGLMIGGAMGKATGLGAIDESLSATDKMKTAFSEIKEDLTYRLYLDKLFTPKADKTTLPASTTTPGTAVPAIATNPVSGLGEIDVFVAGDAFRDDPDMKQLSRLEDQLKISARDFDTQQREFTPAVVSTTSLSATPQAEEADEDYFTFSGGRNL
ncbi:MAG: hypothetical protein MUC87_03545 [Bacteroidia bacterium]|jgi:hypothetical protein|nr:hypothetical protein [Bacteroidia bacterium]